MAKLLLLAVLAGCGYPKPAPLVALRELGPDPTSHAIEHAPSPPLHRRHPVLHVN